MRVGLRVKEVVDDETALFAGQLGGRFEPELQMAIPRAASREGFQLKEQRRNQIEGEFDPWKFVEERHHPVVVLEGMQADPRQDVLTGREILVVGLVHVPENGDFGHCAMFR